MLGPSNNKTKASAILTVEFNGNKMNLRSLVFALSALSYFWTQGTSKMTLLKVAISAFKCERPCCWLGWGQPGGLCHGWHRPRPGRAQRAPERRSRQSRRGFFPFPKPERFQERDL